MPAGGGAWHSPRPRRRLALRSVGCREPLVSLSDAAERVGVTPATLRRRIRHGLIPQYNGEWTPAGIRQARVVVRMRESGHSLKQIRTATDEGRLSFGFLEELLPSEPQRYSFQGRRARDAIGEVTLKGFSESTEVFVAHQRQEESG